MKRGKVAGTQEEEEGRYKERPDRQRGGKLRKREAKEEINENGSLKEGIQKIHIGCEQEKATEEVKGKSKKAGEGIIKVKGN